MDFAIYYYSQFKKRIDKKFYNFIIVTFFLINSNIANGQNLNLVPVDSANFQIIADSLFDIYSNLPDSLKFNPELYKICPCEIDSLIGLVSYKTSSFFIKRNKCLFIYKKDSEYFIRVGHMTNIKDNLGKYVWNFSNGKMKREIAELYINKTIQEIEKAKIPRFKDHIIVTDGTSYTFGNLDKRKYATTPITNYSNDVIGLIRFSERLIKKYR